MARNKAEAVLAQRPFIMVFQDFLDSSILTNCYQKILYIYLKLFADENGKCFPSIKRLVKLTKISINKVKSTLSELIEMGLVTKEHRTRPDGGTDTNLYTINDTQETWGARARTDGKRPFIKVYKDFLYNEKLETCQQKLIYIYLGKFADARQQCFPSIRKLAEVASIGITKVKYTIKELIEKGLINKKNRWRTDGGKNSNLYTLLYNIIGKFNNCDCKEMNDSIDYTVENEKELDSRPGKVKNQALPNNHIDNYTKPNSADCQEKYTMEKIHEYFEYDIIITDNPDYKNDVDAVMGVLYDTLNTSKQTIMVNGENRPSQIVISSLMKLDRWAIMYAIDQFKKQDDQRIKNPKAYMRSIIYNAATGGYELSLKNQVAYNEAHWYENPNNPERKDE